MSSHDMGHAVERPMTGVAYLSVRIARLALDLDNVTVELETQTIGEAEALLLTAPSQHLRIAVDHVEDLIYQAEKLDQRRSHTVGSAEAA